MTSLGKRRRIRTAVTLAIALAATGLAMFAEVARPTVDLISLGNEVPYDTIYKLRPPHTRPDVPIVLVEVDDASLAEAAATGENRMAQQWPWPRAMWGFFVNYFQAQGARCVVFDLHFTEPAIRGGSDDEEFAAALDAATVPVVISGGNAAHAFAPRTKNPVTLGDVQVTPRSNYRTYLPDTPRGPSLALAAVRAAGLTPKLPTDRPIRLLYHGPHRWQDRQHDTVPTTDHSVHPALTASRVFFAAYNAADALPKETFKDKIVVIGTTATGLSDNKVAPVGEFYPGVEVHATAIDNLISGQSVRVAPDWLPAVFALLLSAAVAAVVIFARSLPIKVGLMTACAATLAAASFFPLLAASPFWLPPMVPLIATAFALVVALIYTYRIEDARARGLLRALGQCVSPYVAAELADEPHQLAVGGQQREMTILFSDIEGFTALAERMRERVEPVLNLYLAEMSRLALAVDGTIDKYIGDAMMVFWNAPIDQADHAARACRAALSIVARERALAGRFIELGAGALRTRIGINTGPNVVGFFGSEQRLSYTAIGDAVNLAARLEPRNKDYRTQILVADATRALAGDAFVFRRLDRLKVYGRTEPAEVFELMAERAAADEATLWLAERFEVAIGRYFAQDWAAADAALGAIFARFYRDGPATVLRDRIAAFRIDPPGADWNGVFTATSK